MRSVEVANPYWDAVVGRVCHDVQGIDGLVGTSGVVVETVDVPGLGSGLPAGRMPTIPHDRNELVRQYAWTITDPCTVEFVAGWCGPAVVDPMAGSGYWALTLAELGVDVVAGDVASAGNSWHPAGATWWPVVRGDGVDVVADHGDRSLLLSWPPYDTSDGVNVLRAYSGDRVVFMGECGCCGDTDLYAALVDGWVQVAERVPVRWWGFRDSVMVFDRR